MMIRKRQLHGSALKLKQQKFHRRFLHRDMLSEEKQFAFAFSLETDEGTSRHSVGSLPESGCDNTHGDWYASMTEETIADPDDWELLRYYSGGDESLVHVVVNAILKERTPELFVNAASSMSTIGVAALVKYSSHFGDIHDAISAIVAWKKEKQTNREVNTKKWCDENGIRVDSLTIIMKHVDMINDSCSDEKDTCGNLEDDCLRMIECSFSNDVCYYLGHPDLGYKHLKTGEVIPCCPASSLHLLDKMPEFVIACGFRHIHAGRGNQQCRYMVALDDNVGKRLASFDKSSFSKASVDGERVSEVKGILDCSQYTRGMIKRRWRDEDDTSSLKNHLIAQCNGTPVIMDMVHDERLAFYALIEYHDKVKSFINKKLLNIRETLSETVSMPSLTKNNSGVRLLLSAGCVCDKVYINEIYDYSVKQGFLYREDLNRLSRTVEVDVELLTDKLTLQRHHSVVDQSEASVGCLKYLLSHISENQWQGSTEARLSFVNPIVVRGAMYSMSKSKNIKVTNKEEIELQSRTMRVYLDGRVFSVVGDLLIKKLKHFHKSMKYRANYEMRIVSLNDVAIHITTTSVQHCEELADKIRDVITALKVSTKRSTEQSDFALTLLIIARQTGTWIRMAEKHLVEVYGERSRRKLARELLSEYTSVEIQNTAQFVRKHRSFFANFLSSDIDVMLNNIKNISIEDLFSDLSPDTFEMVIDIRLDTERNRYTSLLLRGEYSPLFSDVLYILPQISKQQVTCVVCWTDITSYYTLESCAHCYCYECVNNQIKTALSDNKLPLSCASCDKPFTIVDIYNLSHSSLVPSCKLSRLCTMAMNQFVAANPKLYSFCPRAGCQNIFKKSIVSSKGLECSVCRTNVCGKCWEVFHKGLDCHEYRELMTWIEESPTSRKICPHCTMIIEKNGGCSCLRCLNCEMFLCWTCLQYSVSASVIFSHIRNLSH